MDEVGLDRLSGASTATSREHHCAPKVLTLVAVVGVALVCGAGVLVAPRTWSDQHHARTHTAVQPSQAAVIFQQPGFVPGEERLHRLGPQVAMTHMGSGTLHLGTRPATANATILSFTCLSAGTFRWSSGDSVTCDSGDGSSRPTSPHNVLHLAPDQHSFTITTSTSARWRLTARYVHATTTSWGINASGESYGVANQNGTPDLVAAYARNGAFGFLKTTDENGTGSSHATLPVYDSDGVTVVGYFRVTDGHSDGTRGRS